MAIGQESHRTQELPCGPSSCEYMVQIKKLRAPHGFAVKLTRISKLGLGLF